MSAGGPALSMYYTALGLRALGIDVSILADYFPNREDLIGEHVPIFQWKRKPVTPAVYIPNFYETISSLPKPDLIHIQGIWQYSYHQIVKYALHEGIPYILTPRGALYPQALEKSKFKKKLSRIIYQDRDLTHADCVLATCEDELSHYRNLGFKNPVAIIPNPIDVESIIGSEIPLKQKKKVGYLGRMHPRKHVERLIQAFHDLRKVAKDAELIIIGSGDAEYTDYLKNLINKYGLKNVTLTGFLRGDEKDKTIRDLSLVALPSDFENFGNVISEALVRGVPVLTTKGAPWKIVEEHSCGWWIDNNQESINNKIAEFLQLSASEVREMGIRGIEMIKDNFSVERVALKNKQLYEWLLNKAPKPDFIY